MEIKKVGKIQFTEWTGEEYKQFLDRHEDLKLLSKARVTVNGLASDFADRLKRAEDEYIDPNERERLEFAKDELEHVWAQLNKVSDLIRAIHIREEQESGRAEE